MYDIDLTRYSADCLRKYVDVDEVSKRKRKDEDEFKGRSNSSERNETRRPLAKTVQAGQVVGGRPDNAICDVQVVLARHKMLPDWMCATLMCVNRL
ncbi:hypothetical protein Tcan_12479 [Toxocara canis]|uniref:Uncharacterized protein n=1 Tax=Toxocara canis TaxID=6265 RepID=A0A0B2V7S4_TOXCA|nr:hypothetical protein Tcan_12479 [Toxocara canis]